MKAKGSQKIIISIASVFVGVALYMGAYACFSRSLTAEQLDAPVSFEERTGMDKLKARFDALSVAGLGFGISMALLFWKLKRTQKKIEKENAQ